MSEPYPRGATTCAAMFRVAPYSPGEAMCKKSIVCLLQGPADSDLEDLRAASSGFSKIII